MDGKATERTGAAIAVALLGILALVGGQADAAAGTGYCQASYCTTPPACSGVGTGQADYSDLTLTNVNFRSEPADFLVGASFKNATLIGVNFAGMDLSQADFTGATFEANSQGTLTDLSGTTLTQTCFTGADLSGANLQFATYDQTDFSCASLLDARIGPLMTFSGGPSARTRFSYAQLGIASQAGSDLFPLATMSTMGAAFWPRTDFTCSRFVGLSQSNFPTAGLDLSGAVLRGAVLDGYTFYDDDDTAACKLVGADLSGASLRNTDLRYCNLDGIQLSQADLSAADLTEASFYTSRQADLQKATLTGTQLNHATLDYADLAGAVLSAVQAQQASFNNCNLQPGPSIPATLVSNSDFSGATFANASLNNVRFRGSAFNSTSFRRLTLSGTDFSGDALVGASFEETTLQDVAFDSTQLNNADFRSATLSATQNGAGVDFTCAQLGGADFSSAIVRKAVFQAAVMPPDADCCQQVDGTYYCGQAVDGSDYGSVILPVLPPGVSVACPNGSVTDCSGEDWVIPHWQTAVCNPAGTLQTVWRKPQCGSAPHSINIPDANLRACLQEALFGGADEPITKTAAASLQFLSCPGKGIGDLTGLDSSNFPALVTLDLSANDLSGTGDFSSFSDQLQTLRLSYNGYTQLVFSDDQTQLNLLDASNNALTAIQVSPNSYLTYLDLSHNQLSGTLDFFNTRQNNLSYLDLSFNALTSIGDADDLQTANSIYLQSNNLTTIGSVSRLWQNGDGTLFYLNLSQNACFQCGTLDVSQSVTRQFGCSCDPATCGSCDSP